MPYRIDYTNRRVAGRLYLRDAAAPVYEGETEEEALARAVREVPAFRERAARVRAQRAAGYPDAVPDGDVDRFLEQLGDTPPRGRPPGTSKEGDFKGRILVRVPISVHRELAERAQAEGTTINQLILHYISRGLAADAAAR